jgi:hypothetical protein
MKIVSILLVLITCGISQCTVQKNVQFYNFLLCVSCSTLSQAQPVVIRSCPRHISVTVFIKSRQLRRTPFHFIIYKSSHSVFTKPGKRKLGVNRFIVKVCVLFNDIICVWNCRPIASDTVWLSDTQTITIDLFTPTFCLSGFVKTEIQMFAIWMHSNMFCDGGTCSDFVIQRMKLEKFLYKFPRCTLKPAAGIDDFRLPPRSRWELRSSGLLRSE